MLETPALLLHPWQASPLGSVHIRQRTVLDATTGEPLGFVGERARSHWLRWLTRKVLQVYETEDASLLCSIFCPWGWIRSWEVYDADDHPVGTYRGNLLSDRWNRHCAVVQRGPDGSQRFVNTDGLELASLTRANGELLLSFAGVIEGEPFARMLLLAGALTFG
jgi:hypothetical protein